jgi:uncharacterized protein (DUF1778 family)
MSENEKLAEFFRKAPRSTIKVDPEAYNALSDQLENPSKINPALVLAMDRARRIRSAREES